MVSGTGNSKNTFTASGISPLTSAVVYGLFDDEKGEEAKLFW